MNIVTIGGGGGHSQILQGLRGLNRPNLSITAVCPSTDSGGSTGFFRRELGGFGYLGDLTKCVLALSGNEPLALCLKRRRDAGLLEGHSLKNILFHYLQSDVGLEQALETMHEICQVKRHHRVIPVTTEQTDLYARLRIGNEVVGETNIDLISQNPLWNPDHHAIEDIYLKPDVEISNTTLQALYSARWLVICPGDLYSSILPVLLPREVKGALVENRRLSVVMVLNIVTKPGETDGYEAMDFVLQVEKRLGRLCDFVLANSSTLPTEILGRYRLEQKSPVVLPKAVDTERQWRSAPLLQVTEDGLLYHDPDLTAIELVKIFDA